jgi:NAD(P)-dependent dehydrogenase (short-subunit alcohol dehydrogenase family)
MDLLIEPPPPAAYDPTDHPNLSRPVDQPERNQLVPASAPQTALLVGTSRGLGLGLAREYLSRGWRVIATARDNDRALTALAGKDRLAIEHVDIADPAAVAALRRRLAGERLDLLFVIAGISGPIDSPIHAVPPDKVAHVYLTNAYYPVCFAEAFAELVQPNGTFAFMSSFLGSITSNTTGGWETYRASKAALNMLAHNFFLRHPRHSVLSISPGWVRTDMGGADAPLDVETSVRGIADAIAARQGRFEHVFVHHDGQQLPW